MSLQDRVFIRVFRGDDLQEVFQSAEQQIIIGQEGEAHLKLKGNSVSVVHAMIEKRDSGFYICDLGSQSGTFQNGSQVLDAALVSGDVITIGEYRLEFSIGLPKVASAEGKKEELPRKVPPPVTPIKEEKKIPEKKTKVDDQHIKTQSTSTPVAKSVTKPASPSAQAQKPKEPSRFHQIEDIQSLEEVSQKFEIPRHVVGTFAPKSEVINLDEYIQPSKGTVVEVSIAWKERILNTYHFDSKQTVTIGSHPKNTIVLPIFDSRVSHPLIYIGSQVKVFVTSDMDGSIRLKDQTTTIHNMILGGRLQREGAGYGIILEQMSLVRIDLGSDVCAYIRYVSPTPKPLAAPLLFLSTSEIATILATLLFFGILGLYFTIYSPETNLEQNKEDEIPKKAAFVYDKPKQRLEVSEPKSAQTTAQPIKDLEKAKSRGEEGKASEAMPNKSHSQVKKLTTPNPGTGKGIVRANVNQKAKPDSGAKSPKPDPTKMGIFSAFGSKGFQDQLSKTYSGAGSLSGVADKATGSGGQNAVGSGDTPGTGLKDVGAGGEGTSTYGIAGVHTKGRGGGVSGYGTGNLGAKSRATIVPGGEGEEFSAGIDREAIRRVILSNTRQIQACYEKGLNKQPNLYGKVLIEWIITTNGRVASARVASSTLNSPEVESCVVSRLRTWKFPEPPPDQEAQVTYPFLFNAQ